MVVALLLAHNDGVPSTQEELMNIGVQYGATFSVISQVNRVIHAFGGKRDDSGELKWVDRAIR